jgi:galactonate dehydratase
MAMRIAAVEPVLVGTGMYVLIRAEDGTVGLGQSACWAYPRAVQEIILKFRAYLIGKDPLQIEHHWQHLYRMGPFRGSVLSGAISAVDLALWDLKGKHYQAPVWDLLGGKCRDKIRLHLLMGGDSPDEIAANAREAAREGFTAIKFDPLPAGYQDMSTAALVDAVVARAAAAREAVGRDVDLILEIHRKLTPIQSLPVCEAVAQFHPLFVEDPIQIDSIVSQAEIARRVSVGIANGERLHTIWEFRELLATGGSQFVRPDVGLAGGLTHCKKIAAIAESYHAAVVTHNFLGPVLTAASVNLDTAIPNFVVQEYSKVDEAPSSAIFKCAVRRQGGYLNVPETPGLGVALDESRLADFPATEWEIHHAPLRSDGSVALAV